MESQIDDVQRQRINAILDYWFGEGVNRDGDLHPESGKKWFMGGEAVDSYIKESF